MIKRLLNYSPKEMHQLTSEELFYAMKMDEGRTVEGLANCAAPNYLEDTSNAEVCAAFGCDVVFLDGHNPDNVVFPGLPSKNPEDDTPYKFLTTGIGKGWSVRDVRTLIGRPLACGLYIDPDCSGNLNKVKYNGVYASRENIEKVIEEGFDIIGVYGWAKPEILVDLVKSVADQINGRAFLKSGLCRAREQTIYRTSPTICVSFLTRSLQQSLSRTAHRLFICRE